MNYITRECQYTMPRTKSTEPKQPKDPVTRFTFICDEALFSDFKLLCSLDETTPSEFIVDYITRVVKDNTDKIQTLREMQRNIKK